MRRKRSASNILKDTIPSTSTSSTPNQPFTEDIKITTRKPKTKVQCFCSKCNGKLVDPRTKTAHEQKEQPISLDSLQSDQLTPLPAILPNETQMTQVLVNPFDLTMEIEKHLPQTTIDTNIYEEQPFTFLPRKKRVKARYINKVKSKYQMKVVLKILIIIYQPNMKRMISNLENLRHKKTNLLQITTNCLKIIHILYL